MPSASQPPRFSPALILPVRVGLPALPAPYVGTVVLEWNACPMKREAGFIGAKPIPLGWPNQPSNSKPESDK